MSQHNADVMVHIDECLDEDSLRHLEADIKENRGVVRVVHNPSRPHLLMVDFDAAVIRSGVVLNEIRGHGMHAQLVGF